MIRKRIYLTAAIFLLVVSFSAYYLYRVNRSARSRLEYANGLIEVNPRKALEDVEQINRTFLSERNYDVRFSKSRCSHRHTGISCAGFAT